MPFVDYILAINMTLEKYQRTDAYRTSLNSQLDKLFWDLWDFDVATKF